MHPLYWSVAIACAFLLPCAGASNAQTTAYPSKLVRIVTAATGSANDWGSRVLAQEHAIYPNALRLVASGASSHIAPFMSGASAAMSRYFARTASQSRLPWRSS